MGRALGSGGEGEGNGLGGKRGCRGRAGEPGTGWPSGSRGIGRGGQEGGRGVVGRRAARAERRGMKAKL